MSAAASIALTASGWIGAIAAVIAYGLVTTRRITPDSLRFQGLNLVGAGLMGISSTVYGAWPSAVVNVIWVVIGFFAIRALVLARRRAVVPLTGTLDEADLAAGAEATTDAPRAPDASDAVPAVVPAEWNSEQRTPVAA
jgi:hypothetical protein